jgi:hypothetical protein
MPVPARLGFADLVALAKQSGLKGDPRVAAAIAMAESSGNPQAFNPVGRDHSLGLWQINQLAHKGQFGSDEQLKDPVTNAQAMAALFNRRGNFNDWSTYTSGAYRKFLPGGDRYGALRSAGLAGGDDPTSPRQAAGGSPGSGSTGSSLPPTSFPQWDPALLEKLTPKPRQGLLSMLLFGNKGLDGMLPESVRERGLLGSLLNELTSPTASGGQPAGGADSSTAPPPASMIGAPLPETSRNPEVDRDGASVPMPPRRPADLMRRPEHHMPDRAPMEQAPFRIEPFMGSAINPHSQGEETLRALMGIA